MKSTTSPLTTSFSLSSKSAEPANNMFMSSMRSVSRLALRDTEPEMEYANKSNVYLGFIGEMINVSNANHNRQLRIAYSLADMVLD